MTPKQEQAVMIRTIGNRLKEARQLCGYSQIKAAKLLGYQNSSKLAKVENATDTNSIPLWLIKRAALLYEVSVDWLYGLSDDWEISQRMLQERNTEHWLFQHWEKQRQEDIQVLRYLHEKIDAITQAVRDSLNDIYGIDYALENVRNINKKFDSDIRGGSKLVSAVEKAKEAAKISSAKLNRYFGECKVLKSEDELELFPDLSPVQEPRLES